MVKCVHGAVDGTGIEVEELLIKDHAVPALIQASEGADVLVVGSRGLGGFSGMMLGSVSQAVLHHATCPVRVVPLEPGEHPA